MGLKSLAIGGAITFALVSYGGQALPNFDETLDGLLKSEEEAALEINLMAEELKRSALDTEIKSLDFQLAERKTRLELVALERQIGEAQIQLEVERRLADERVSQELDRAYMTSQVWLAIEAAWLLIVALIAPLVAVCAWIAKMMGAYGRYKRAKEVSYE